MLNCWNPTRAPRDHDAGAAAAAGAGEAGASGVDVWAKAASGSRTASAMGRMGFPPARPHLQRRRQRVTTREAEAVRGDDRRAATRAGALRTNWQSLRAPAARR